MKKYLMGTGFLKKDRATRKKTTVSSTPKLGSAPLAEKLLGIDTGSKRMGLATFEPKTEWISPLPVYSRKTLKHDLAHLAHIVREHDIEAFVIGLPLSLAGKETPSTHNALFWVETLKEHFGLPVHLHDEALSTTEAHDRLRHIPSKRRKEIRDSAAAAIILEEFIRDQKSKGIVP